MHVGRPLTGKSMGPMVSSVVGSLNRGDVVLPQSAFLSMISTEVR